MSKNVIFLFFVSSWKYKLEHIVSIYTPFQLRFNILLETGINTFLHLHQYKTED